MQNLKIVWFFLFFLFSPEVIVLVSAVHLYLAFSFLPQCTFNFAPTYIIMFSLCGFCFQILFYF